MKWLICGIVSFASLQLVANEDAKPIEDGESMHTWEQTSDKCPRKPVDLEGCAACKKRK